MIFVIIQTVSAELKLKIESGRFYKYLNSREKIRCWILDDNQRSKKFLVVKHLKIRC